AAASSGAAFVPVTDLVPAVDVAHTHINLANVGAVTVQPGHTGVVLAGTGDPTDEPDSLYGTGILRSADGGNSWTSITGSRDPATGLEQNSFFGEAFAGFAWSTSMPNLVVAAVTTAPGAARVNAGYTSVGDDSASGLYYSVDAGQTWLLASVQDGPFQVLQAPGQQTGVVALAVVWNPMRQIFVAALRNHGFYSSQNGAAWTRLQNQPGTALSGLTCRFPGGSNCPIYSAALAVQPGSGDMFAMAVDQNDKDSGLWEDLCSAAGGGCSAQQPVFRKQISIANALETGTGVIAGSAYALWLDAIPSGNDTLLFAGTQDLFRCSMAAGCVWRNATNVNTCPTTTQVGPNQHGVAWVANATTLYFANDRGLWRTGDALNQQEPVCSADDATHFANLNATLGSLAEVTSLAQDPADPNQLLAGVGAAGTAGGNDGAWQLLLNGPGKFTAAGWGANAETWFATSGAGVSISRCTTATCGPGDFGSGPVINNGQVSGDGSALSAPAVWTLDPEDPTRMLVATCRVWRGAADGTNWRSGNALSKMLDGNNAPACQSNNTQVRSLAATGAISGRGDNAERIYVGLAGTPDGAMTHAGHVLTALVTPSSIAGSTTWSDVTGSPVTNDPTDSEVFNRALVGISAIVVDRTDTTGKTVYVGIAGFGGLGFAPLAQANVPQLYGSTDGGSTWQNLTNDLPNAPVNAVLVDPEDPAIVYVGTDVGVYVTTSITQCADVKQNCWSAYGAGLPAVRVTTLSAVDTSAEKWLLAGTKGRGVWQAELASTALKTQVATATITPTTLPFASQAVGTTSAGESLTVRNTGSVALTLGAATVSDVDFVLSNPCPASLAPGASCAISIVFAPTAIGQRSGAVTVAANVQDGVLTANVQGAGTQGGTMVLTPLRLDFGSVRISQTSPVQYMTVANTGAAPAGLKPLTISGPFRISANTCGSSLAVNTSCTVGVVFSPTASGAASGSLVAIDDAGTQTALLSGNGQSSPTDALSATALTFAAQAIGTTSAAQQVTVTNNGDSALTNIKTQVTGDFSVTNLCGTSLPGHSTCALQVVYSPKAVGAERGQMAIQDALGAQVVALNGTGIPPAGGSGVTATLSPLTIDFGTQGVNSISSPQTLTLINTGTNALSGIGWPRVRASPSPTMPAQ
ncbi:MAG TPA: choice-of-anchor D domain-containing protein, partial [Acidobacteriaceae bacterium]